MKKTILTKIFIFSFIFTILLTIFVVPSFADSSNGVFVPGDELVFKDSISNNFIRSGDNYIDFYIVDDTGSRISFSGINFQYRGYIVLTYLSNDGNVQVYDDSGWVNDIYRTIYIEGNYVLDGDFKGFIAFNTDTTVPIYDTLFTLISDTFFGSRDLDPVEKLSITLLCLVICVAIVCIPIVIVYGICIALSRIGMRFI